MVDNELELFTAAEARAAGLFDALARGETKVEGNYELTAGGIKFKQRAFVFKDKTGALRVGRFKDAHELLEAGNANPHEQKGIDFI